MGERTLRVVQVSFFLDPLRTPAQMLDAWSALTLTAEAAAGAGCDVHVVQAAREDETVLREGVTYHFVAERAPSRLRRRAGRWASPITTRVIRQVADLEPDVVHVHGLSYPRNVARLIDGVPAIPVLLQDHADRPPPAWRVRGYRETYRRVAGVMFTAAEQVQPFFEADALPPGPEVFEVIESTSRFRSGPQQPARISTGLHGDPCFLWLGRLDANKDPVTVLRAFSQAA